MLKKIEKAYLLLEKNVELLRCPICHGKFQLEAYALRCENRHTYNLNKKGYVNFLQTKADTEHYTRKMFEPRRRLIQAGMYNKLLMEIQGQLATGNLLDVGTGEGSFLEMLEVEGEKFAFDIARDGIEMATDLETNSSLSLADLTNLPFADGSLSVVLNIFTPSNYAEFQRVLSEKGRVIKIVPDQLYLQELREVYGLPVDYENTAVIDRFKKEFSKVSQQEICYTFDLPENLRLDFLMMSPLEWSVSEEYKRFARENPPEKATIHVQLLVGEK
ncbi:putative RNA methyltransferase [Lactococcus kimchii]|uniref:putative RNA methyltransferase n=1 Tax=Lactococcus sp. S-13 TaxID=2507158 RepID=UPI0010237290|nr:methyltransferase domain-containing protein [Lactococcus sp. S-13]RZI49154.1 methyltransferase domain-containing protein [Lactococcus sp. S-13]